MILMDVIFTSAVARFVETLRHDLSDGTWDAYNGRFPEQAEFDRLLRLVVVEVVKENGSTLISLARFGQIVYAEPVRGIGCCCMKHFCPTAQGR